MAVPQLPTKGPIFLVCQNIFTGSVFNTKPVIKGVQTLWGGRLKKKIEGVLAASLTHEIGLPYLSLDYI